MDGNWSYIWRALVLTDQAGQYELTPGSAGEVLTACITFSLAMGHITALGNGGEPSVRWSELDVKLLR